MVKAKTKLDNETLNKIKVFLLGNTFILLLFIVLLIVYNFTAPRNIVLCPMKTITHLPCPLCGGTRCARSLASFNIVDAFMYHPSTVIFSIYFIYAEIVYFLDIIMRSNMASKLVNYEKTFYIYFFVTLVFYAIRIYYRVNGIDCPFMYTNI